MKVKYDKEVDVLVFQIGQGKIMESDELKPGIILDFDRDGNIAGAANQTAATPTANGPADHCTDWLSLAGIWRDNPIPSLPKNLDSKPGEVGYDNSLRHECLVVLLPVLMRFDKSGCLRVSKPGEKDHH